ncbi:Arylsulfate sulfotransferase AssT precursor [Sedimentisphaera cyanobacteriorum]|uniref:Arylsulfate sulfotransferase AssT n=1 Tax=Sedimentisphaera cyanobacteriorum TaxID=1940790 RepID=A0A1Q2HPQ3_9BACT|nr:aryl-sulfate sulfotransferase [Sedimentisphaera cyanobacteriorum]AQQ09264.1 Arylsulfate sulfotransferase AssT precursor [Sedimentisphaera cyanobacteriorum]
MIKLIKLGLFLLPVLLLAGCRESWLEDSHDPLFFTSKPKVVHNPNESVPLAAVLKFETNHPVTSRVFLSDGECQREIIFENDQTYRKSLPIVQLCPDRNYTLVIEAQDKIGQKINSKVMEFQSPALPEGNQKFPEITNQVFDEYAVEPGFIMFNPRRRIPAKSKEAEGSERKDFNQNFGLLTAVNTEGELVWYYKADSRISDFRFIENGHIIYITQDNRLVEIDLLGNIVNHWYAKGRPEGEGKGVPVDTLTFHHSVKQLENGHFLILGTDRRRIDKYYTSSKNPDAPRKPQWVMGDEIIEFDRWGKVHWRWNAFEHLDPYRIGYMTFSGYWKRRGWPDTIDWSHANSVSYIPEDDAFLCNMRHQSAILKIDKTSKDIEWIAGEPSGWPKELQGKLLELKGTERWFWHQHAPEFTPEGTLLLFNNDNFRARPFEEPAPPAEIRSCAQEYRIDEDNKTITKIWSSRKADDEVLPSFAMGSAKLMPKTGNVLAGFGFMFRQEDLSEASWDTRRQYIGTTQIREYTRRPETRLVRKITLTARDSSSEIGWTLYGARNIKSLYKGK